MQIWKKPGTNTIQDANFGTITDLSDNGITINDNVQGDSISQESSFTLAHNILNIMSDPRLLVLMTDDPTGTINDYSGNGHTGTDVGSMTSGDQLYKGLGYVYDLDGSNDGVDFGDHNDFSFGDSSNDTPFTVGALIEVVPYTANQVIMSKWDGTLTKEWTFQLGSAEFVGLYLRDNSASVHSYVYTQVVSAGYHWVVATYDGRGGSTAGNGINVYIDAILDNDVVGNNGSYVAMENVATEVMLGIRPNNGAYQYPLRGNMGLSFIDGTEWSAYDVWKSYLYIKGTYNL